MFSLNPPHLNVWLCTCFFFSCRNVFENLSFCHLSFYRHHQTWTHFSLHGLFTFRNLLPISHVCIEDGEKPMVMLPYMNWGNLKLFLRQCKLAEANNPQVRLLQYREILCQLWFEAGIKKTTTTKLNTDLFIHYIHQQQDW